MIKKALQEVLEAMPKTILRKMLARKIREAGVDIPQVGVDALVEHILSGQNGDFVWDDTKPEDTGLKLEFTEEDAQEIDAAINRVLEAIPEAVLHASKVTSDQMFKSLRDRWAVEYATQQYELEEFRARMEVRWGEGLGYLRMLLTCCRDIGRETVKRHNKSKSKRNMQRRWVLVRLHARACQVSDEIICLMENGFADGAMARWRTLHELSVVATLIADGDEELAERYILHDAVEVKRQADDYDATHVPLGQPPIGKRQRSSIEQQYRGVLDRFGPTFAHPYGWASEHLNHKKPTFKELQIAANRAGMSSHYKLASFNVHAGARSLFFNLSSMGDQDVLLAGRSNAGLTEPGERTAQTLLLITSLYVCDTVNLDRITMLNSLIRMRDAVTPALLRADRRLLRDERARQKQVVERRARRAKNS